MGKINDFMMSIWKEDPVEYTFAKSIQAPTISDVDHKLLVDQCYVELYLQSLRIDSGRKLATRFHGMVYSFVTLAREGAEKAKLTSVTKPSDLANLDDSNLDKVISINQQLMSPVAYRGGPISLELGLFSVKSGNVLSSVLDYVTRVSDVAGIGSIGQVKPFIPLITGGLDLIAGQTKDTALVVGVDTDLTLSTGCVSAIIAAGKDVIKDESKLVLDKDGKTLLYNNNPLDVGYAVFSIRTNSIKPDYGSIPELSEKYAEFQQAIRKGDKELALEMYNIFRLAVIASSDLIKNDRQILIAKAYDKYLEAFADPRGNVPEDSGSEPSATPSPQKTSPAIPGPLGPGGIRVRGMSSDEAQKKRTKKKAKKSKNKETKKRGAKSGSAIAGSPKRFGVDRMRPEFEKLGDIGLYN